MKRILWNAVRRACATVAIFAAASATAVAQDYTVRMSTNDGTATNYGVATTYVSRNAIRKTEPALNLDIIYRFDEGKIILVKNETKTYSEVTFVQMREANAKKAAEMSPQQKELMGRMGLSAAPAITKLGAGEKIAGYATERYSVKTPMMEMEISAAPALHVPAAYHDVQIASAGQAMAFGGAAEVGEAAKKIDGMILKQVYTKAMMNKTSVIKVATQVDTAPIPASTFEPPAGYKNLSR